MEQAIKAGPVIGDECEEHRVGLTFRCGTVTSVVVDDANLIVHEGRSIALPKRRPILCAAIRDDQHRRE